MSKRWTGMRRGFVWLLAILLCFVVVADAHAVGRAKRILLVGDSWPFFMMIGGVSGLSFWTGCAAQDGLDQAGYSQWTVIGGDTTTSADTAVPMSMAREWRDNLPHAFRGTAVGLLDILRIELEDNPTIDMVHVSLGGNDIGRGYYNDVMPQQIRFIGTPTGGTFMLRFEGQQTGALPFDATAAQIQAAMEGLSNVGAGNIEVTGPVGGPFVCVFDPAIVAYVPSGPDNNISAVSSVTGATMTVDEAHHGWQKSWGTDSDYEKLFWAAINDAIEKVVRTALDVRPDIRVALCDYDYLRIDWGGATELESRVTGMRLGMAKYELMQRLSAMPQYLNRCFFIAPAGLMQYTFGLYSRYNYSGTPYAGASLLYGPNGTAGTAGTVPRPHSNPVPILGGNIDPPVDYYPDDPPGSGHTCDVSPRNVILPDIGGGDIHLNNLGYAALMKYSVEEFYGEWLDQPKVLSCVVDAGKSSPLNRGIKGNDTPAVFVVTFTEPVTGVDESDFQVVLHNGAAGAQILSVSPGIDEFSETYTVTVSRGTGFGTIQLAVIDNGTIVDQDGVPLAGNVDGYYAYGEVFDVRMHTLPLAAWPLGVALLAAAVRVVRRKARA